MSKKRIYILGTAGSGKSSLAKILSKKLNISHYDLDKIYWVNPYIKKLLKNQRKTKLKKILKKRKWIIEGVYGSWTEDAIRQSDLVIWLDPPFRVISWRIIKRYLTRKNKTNEGLKETLGLMKYAKSYKKSDLNSGYKEHKRLVEKHDLNLIVIKNKKQLNKFLRDFHKK